MRTREELIVELQALLAVGQESHTDVVNGLAILLDEELVRPPLEDRVLTIDDVKAAFAKHLEEAGVITEYRSADLMIYNTLKACIDHYHQPQDHVDQARINKAIETYYALSANRKR